MRFKAVAGPFDNQIAEHHSIQEGLDVLNGLFGESCAEFVGEPAAIDRQDLDQVDPVGCI